MTNRVHPLKKDFEFILTIEPGEKLTREQDSALFRESIEKIPRTGLYTKKSRNFLTMFLTLDELENSSPWLDLKQIPYQLIKKEME